MNGSPKILPKPFQNPSQIDEKSNKIDEKTKMIYEVPRMRTQIQKKTFKIEIVLIELATTPRPQPVGKTHPKIRGWSLLPALIALTLPKSQQNLDNFRNENLDWF